MTNALDLQQEPVYIQLKYLKDHIDIENNNNLPRDMARNMIADRIVDLKEILDTVWIIVVMIMIILAQTGFLMKETGSIRMKNNSVILLKTILVIAMSSLTFFIVGFGFCINAFGGLMGQENFIG